MDLDLLVSSTSLTHCLSSFLGPACNEGVGSQLDQTFGCLVPDASVPSSHYGHLPGEIHIRIRWLVTHFPDR